MRALGSDAEGGQRTAEGVSMLGRLDEILARVENSDGTLGLLVNDPSLYEEIQLLVGGAQRSTVLRTLVKLATED